MAGSRCASRRRCSASSASRTAATRASTAASCSTSRTPRTRCVSRPLGPRRPSVPPPPPAGRVFCLSPTPLPADGLFSWGWSSEQSRGGPRQRLRAGRALGPVNTGRLSAGALPPCSAGGHLSGKTREDEAGGARVQGAVRVEREAGEGRECRRAGRGPSGRGADGRARPPGEAAQHVCPSVSSQVMEPRAKLHSESKKPAAKQETAPDLGDSPPVSDSDVSKCRGPRRGCVRGGPRPQPAGAPVSLLGSCSSGAFLCSGSSATRGVSSRGQLAGRRAGGRERVCCRCRSSRRRCGRPPSGARRPSTSSAAC